MAKPNKFWDRFAKRYAKSPVGNEQAYRQKLEITQEHLTSEMEVLEYGCGTGTTAIIHAPLVKHILAVDSSVKMLGIARGKAAEAAISNISFEQSGIEELDRPSQTFDVVMAHSILHLVNDRDQVIAKSYDLLKPGGVFVSSTSCIGSNSKVLQFILPIGNFIGLLPMVRFFSVEELAQSMVQAGFVIEHQWKPEGGDAVFIVARRPA